MSKNKGSSKSFNPGEILIFTIIAYLYRVSIVEPAFRVVRPENRQLDKNKSVF